MRRWGRRMMRMSKDQRLLMQTMNGCWYCGCRLNRHTMTRDHVIPKCDGGSSHISNLVPACRDCNQSKGRMSVDEFRRVHFGGYAGVFYGESLEMKGAAD